MSGIWLDEIQAAMTDLGGDASYSDLNQRIQERNNIDLSSRKDWRAQVRGTIERFSSDSKVFAGKSDIFYSVGGIRSGHWGLRNFQATIENVNLTEDDIGFPEGKKILRQHICRERNPKVIDQAKKIFKASHQGRLFCEACGFTFSDHYGDLGEDFIEGHHKIPVRLFTEESKTNPEDIIMLCSNCHRMIHRLGLTENSLETLRQIILEHIK